MSKEYFEKKKRIIVLDYLQRFNSITCYTYPFPTGRLYIFGDSQSIKLLLFGHHVNHKDEIEGKYKNDITKEIEKTIEFLDSYLLGKKSPFPQMDLSSFTKKEVSVYNQLKKISFGKTISYNKLSEKAGIKKGARFVGNVMAKNLFPIIAPCHRVIKTGGDMGNFSAGIATKRFLLQHENVLLKSPLTDG